MRSVVCLVIDGLHAGMVGAYGNAWIHTPQFDRLAAESTVFDEAFVDTPVVVQWYDCVWSSALPGTATPESAASGDSLIDRARACGLQAVLITDDAEVARHPLASRFDEVIHVAPPAGERPPTISASPRVVGAVASEADLAEPADSIEETRLAQFFAAASDWLLESDRPFFLWLHTRGLYRPWDAPYALRAQHAEEGDPPPPPSTAVPDRMLADDFDPDEALGALHGYAGQIEALDLLLGSLLDTLQAAGLVDDTLLAVLSARGFGLGEHRRLGLCDAALYNEMIQAVMMIRDAGGPAGRRRGAAVRCSALTHTSQVAATIDEWLHEVDATDASESTAPAVSQAVERAGSLLGQMSPAGSPLRRELLLIHGASGEISCRTQAWLLRLPGGDEADKCELYSKPSDRWEVNEVSARAHDVAQRLGDVARRELSLPPDAPREPLSADLVTESD